MSRTPLLVTADDFGLTRATCEAILTAHREGIVTATSVLAVGAAAEHGLGLLSTEPDLAVGVHLALVGEDPPLCDPATIPTLVDVRGRFAPSWRQLLARLAAGRVDPGDVRRELSAQIDRVAAVVPVAHLDAHQHVHLWPTIGRIVVDLAVERSVPAVRVPRPRHGGPRARALRAAADRLEREVRRRGRRTTDRFAGLDEAGGWTASALIQALRDLSGPGSVEINVHPGAVDDPERSRFAWGYGWARELEALCDPDVRRVVDRLGFDLGPP